MLGIIWTLLLTVKAQDLMSSIVEPKDLLKPELQSEEDQSYTQSMLQRYAKNSKYVVAGEIIDVRDLETNSGKDKEADVLVSTWLRGDTNKLITIFIPYNAPFVEGEYSSVPGKVIRGYEIVAFLDGQRRVVEGNGLFYTDGEYLWRNKRPTTFLHPGFDREWYTQNPYDDYVVTSMGEVKSWLVKQKMGSWLR